MCIFCKIVAGEIPSHKIYEDENVLAFLDIAPVNPGHILVITKNHYTNFEDTPEEELANLIKAIKKVGRAIKKGLGASGYNVTENNDPAAGQIIPHIHFHVIPRNKGDGLKLWPQGKYIEGGGEEVVKKIKGVL
ncbi:HIT family protein [Candidatus Falkowbacteria bacterium CG11_big_fil_rev_8_21_14_0_20_39_10]|uniref:HIT family protein n=1 Tax=Candidatus Falkowbacteria bacterium CG11_big_fil_rev_8_21_14_0_20_39_10 TaxID=1974570 RepID=A0A2M6K9P6_9BACT|nr:MAG: HIT family protein [Candidatus Falkowbacteria bacterium CG11_big_fil_rev_8_21_14_0_20_39_10]